MLPKGARLMKPARLSLGGWSKLTYDAKVLRSGITWYRVKGGLAEEDNSREDWIADTPEICVSVHDYQWNGDSFGTNYGSFDKAVRGEAKRFLAFGKHRLEELQQKIAGLKTGIAILEGSIRK